LPLEQSRRLFCETVLDILRSLEASGFFLLGRTGQERARMTDYLKSYGFMEMHSDSDTEETYDSLAATKRDFCKLDFQLPDVIQDLGIEYVSFIGGRNWVAENSLPSIRLPSLGSERHLIIRNILDGFDLNCCQAAVMPNFYSLAYPELDFTLLEGVERALREHTMHLRKPNRGSLVRLIKYTERGFVLQNEQAVIAYYGRMWLDFKENSEAGTARAAGAK
jgi:hypothetical protein